jgi:hypothetical protein
MSIDQLNALCAHPTFDTPAWLAAVFTNWGPQLVRVKTYAGGSTVCCVSVPTKSKGDDGAGHAQLTISMKLPAMPPGHDLRGKKAMVHVLYAIGCQMVHQGTLEQTDTGFRRLAGVPHVPFFLPVAGGDYSHAYAPSRPSDNAALLEQVKGANTRAGGGSIMSVEHWNLLESIECHGHTGVEPAARNQLRKICGARPTPSAAMVAIGLLCRCYAGAGDSPCKFWTQ